MRLFVDIPRFSRFFTKDLSSLITRRSLVQILPPQPQNRLIQYESGGIYYASSLYACEKSAGNQLAFRQQKTGSRAVSFDLELTALHGFGGYAVTFSKSEAGCLHRGQMKSSGSSSPTYSYPQILQRHTVLPSAVFSFFSGLGLIEF